MTRHLFARQRGFSAVEIIAVATIIAILSLILIPKLTTRVQDSKLIAAKDELNQLERITTLCFADTGQWFRLQDYDNALPSLEANPTNVPPEESISRWGLQDIFKPVDYNRARLTWKGPYTQFQKTISLKSLMESYPEIYSSLNKQQGGPIFLSDTSPVDEVAANQQYPVDPWGNPYLFFAPGKLVISGVTTNETNYASPIVYSMGPNGVPGDMTDPANPPASKDYMRQFGGPLGTGDDISRQF